MNGDKGPGLTQTIAEPSGALHRQDPWSDERMAMLVHTLDWFKDPLQGLEMILSFYECRQGLSRKALELANSPYYGSPCPLTRISQAAAVLGARHFSRIIATTLVLDLLKCEGSGHPHCPAANNPCIAGG